MLKKVFYLEVDGLFRKPNKVHTMKSCLADTFNYHDMADCLDELPFWSAAFGLALLDKILYRPGIAALDIGFGTGFPLIELAMRLGPSATVYGIDPSDAMHSRTLQKIAAGGSTNIRLISGAAESIPLPDQSIDLITSNNGINNVNDVGRVFAECARIMKPGGQFIWTMNTDATMIEFYTALEQVLSKRGMAGEIEAMHQHIAQKRPPVDRLVSHMHAQGFCRTNVTNDCFHYRFSDGTAMLNHFFIRIAYMGPWKALLPAAIVEELFTEVEVRLNEQAALSGGLSLTIPFVVMTTFRH
jgi:ubiquinone/menaquinone biosynthesis C-methylase UbiE